MSPKATITVTIAVTLPTADMALVNKFIAINQGTRNSRGLVTMWLEDVAAASRAFRRSSTVPSGRRPSE
jgi:hypothetical protein